MSGMWVSAHPQNAVVNLERARSLEVVSGWPWVRDESRDSALIAVFDGGTWYSIHQSTEAGCIAARTKIVELLGGLQ